MRRRRRHYKNKYSLGEGNTPYYIMIPVICVLGALVFAVALGTLLGRRNDGSTDDGGNDRYKNYITKKYTGEVLKTPGVISGNIEVGDLIGDENEIATAYYEKAAAEGFDGISFNLKNAGGAVTFVNETEQTLSPGTDMTGRIRLAQTASAFKVKGIRTTGIFYCNAFSGSGAVRRANEALECSLIAEAGLCGIDEVILMNLPHTPEDADRIISYVSDASGKTSATLITALPYKLLDENGCAEYLTYLARSCDGLAIDFTGFLIPETAGDGEVPEKNNYALCEYLESVNIIYYLERYNIRILLPKSLSEQLSILRNAGYSNIGIIG